MARSLYTLLFYLLLPLIVLRLAYRALRAPAYAQRLGERFGRFRQRPAPGGIWVHAVSVGETIAAVPLVRELLRRYPDRAVTVTTMTPTGSERVRALLGESVFHVYAPYDLPFAWRGFLSRVQPELALVMETELWPNCVAACQHRGVPLILANARLSERSARGYGRLGALTRGMLRQLHSVAAQTVEHGQRFVALGLPEAHLRVTGSIKFDLDLPLELRQRAAALKRDWSDGGRRPIWIAASTHEGEEAVILEAHRLILRRYPETLLVLVPRHPERFAGVARQIAAAQLTLARRSADSDVAGAQVLLGDTMGELLLLFGAADVAFVGGSLIERGGHNVLEPAAWGLPVLTGPSDFNFAEISRLLRDAEAQWIVRDSAELSAALQRYLEDAELSARHGAAALGVVEANRGALRKLLGVIGECLPTEPRNA